MEKGGGTYVESSPSSDCTHAPTGEDVVGVPSNVEVGVGRYQGAEVVLVEIGVGHWWRSGSRLWISGDEANEVSDVDEYGVPNVPAA